MPANETTGINNLFGIGPDGEVKALHVGDTGGVDLASRSKIITPSLVVDTAVYASGDCIGGKLTLASAVRSSGGTALLQSLLVIDAANQKPALEILIFDSNPTAGTYTDNVAVALSTDTAKLIRRVQVLASDYVTIGGVAIAEVAVGGRVLQASGSTSLYAVLVAQGAPDFAAGTDLVVRFGLLQD